MSNEITSSDSPSFEGLTLSAISCKEELDSFLQTLSRLADINIADDLSCRSFSLFLEDTSLFKRQISNRLKKGITISDELMRHMWRYRFCPILSKCRKNLEGALKSLPYKEYLQTDHWQTCRQKARKRADGKCQLCNASNQELHTHHRSYKRRGTKEELDDLIVLCKSCHQKIHNIPS